MSLKEVARQTLSILDAGGFDVPDGARVDFRSELASAVASTRLYAPAEAEALVEDGRAGDAAPVIDVTDETTQVAAHRLVVNEQVSDLVLLNFASARNPGGGFVTGAKAQEEDLARCSGLYPSLLTQPAYYDANRAESSLLYTDHIIYSPFIPWFRTRSRNLLDTFFLASVITAPAPNAGEYLRRDPGSEQDVETCLRRRAALVLSVARAHSHRTVLLGAWGCGVFRNDPRVVAEAFKSHLASSAFAGAFDRIVFAVYDPSKDRATLAAFQHCFSF